MEVAPGLVEALRQAVVQDPVGGPGSLVSPASLRLEAAAPLEEWDGLWAAFYRLRSLVRGQGERWFQGLTLAERVGVEGEHPSWLLPAGMGGVLRAGEDENDQQLPIWGVSGGYSPGLPGSERLRSAFVLVAGFCRTEVLAVELVAVNGGRRPAQRVGSAFVGLIPGSSFQLAYLRAELSSGGQFRWTARGDSK